MKKSKKPHPYVPRINDGGNYCGHDKENPRLNIPDLASNLPRIITMFCERLDSYYYRPKFTLPLLESANGSKKQHNSCAREGVIRFLKVIVAHTEISSLRVGYYSSDGFCNYTVAWLAERAGISYKRACRYIRLLKKIGYLTLTNVCEKLDDGTYKGTAAVKAVSPYLWYVLGMESFLKHQRKKKSERIKSGGIKTDRYSKSRTQQLKDKDQVRAVLVQAKNVLSPTAVVNKLKKNQKSNEANNRSIAEKIYQLTQQYPNASSAWLLEEARKLE